MLGLGLGISRNNYIGGGVNFDADYQAVLDYATTQGYTLPSIGQQMLQNQMLIDLKLSGVWNKLDTFAKFDVDADSNFALIDWKRLTQYTAVNNPTFTANQGFTGNGSSTYIDTNYNPFSQAINFQLNNACMGTYIRTAPAVPNLAKAVFGTGDTNGIVFIPQFSNQTSIRLNSSSAVGYSNTTQVGSWIFSRSTNSNITTYKNGIIISSPRLSTAISDRKIFLLRRNDTTPMWWDGQISYFFAGASLSEIEAKTLTGILENYLNGGVGNKLGIFFGDSITAGTGASVTANRWTSVFSGLQTIMEMNCGIAGTTMVQNPTTPTGTSMYERMNLIPNYVGADKFLFFAYGTNDASAPSTFTTTLFETQYNEVIANAISKGWPANKIKLVNIFRRDDTKENAYNLKLIDIANTNGVQVLDVNSVLSANPTLYMADALHPNDTGHSAIANYINSNITL